MFTDIKKSLLIIIFLLLPGCATFPENLSGDFSIPIPSTPHQFKFSSKHIKLEIKDEKRAYYYLIDHTSGLLIFFNFENARECDSSESCRDYFAKRIKKLYPDRTNWTFSQIGDVFVFENMDKMYQGIDLQHHHMYAQYVIDGVWIDLYLSKVGFQKKDRKIFVEFQ